ncbi:MULTISPECIES: hypothetical protein [Aquimarina]|uniref:hypothetical protein n=1 Tax=Aquimarina TaxID=290174 RepID=UPI000942BD7D|nr:MULTISPECIES: hypothetical protein [Aquimarina]
MKIKTCKNVNYSILILFIGAFLFSSCEKEEVVSSEKENTILKNSDSKNLKRETIGVSTCASFDRSSCSDDLVLDVDECNFISGSGRDMPHQYIIDDLLNNCRTEELPSNCTWWRGNITQTRIIKLYLNNCCNSADVFNSRLDGWMDLAIDNKPNSSFLVTNYERLPGGIMHNSPFGPYEIRIRVTYRKKICSISSLPDGIRK